MVLTLKSLNFIYDVFYYRLLCTRVHCTRALIAPLLSIWSHVRKPKRRRWRRRKKNIDCDSRNKKEDKEEGKRTTKGKRKLVAVKIERT